MKPLRSVSLPFLLTATTALALAGCATVGPDYLPPAPEVGEGWAKAEATAPIPPEELGRWWQRFADPTLDRLVESALEQNLDIHRAAARLAEARALRDRTAGRELPSVEAAGSVGATRSSENGSLPIDRIPGFERDQVLVDLGVDASWQLDLFGGTRRALEGAEANLGAAREEHRAVQFAVAAEVAATYLELRGSQRRLAASEAARDSLGRTAELVKLRAEAGEIPRLELHRVESELWALEARLPAQRSEIEALALSLGPLVGTLPEAQLVLLQDEPSVPRLAPFPLGERSSLLGRRPDVRAAERRLAAATAEVGVATAELYPRLVIGARGGFQALDGDGLFEASSVTASLVPSIHWRIFDGGRVRAEIRMAEARAEAEAHAFESAVIRALADAERALVRYRGSLDGIEAQQAAVDSARRARELEDVRHRAGDSSLLALLDTERRLDERSAELEESRTRAARDLVALVMALGGGWSGEPGSAAR